MRGIGDRISAVIGLLALIALLLTSSSSSVAGKARRSITVSFPLNKLFIILCFLSCSLLLILMMMMMQENEVMQKKSQCYADIERYLLILLCSILTNVI